jgi:hypothetical protein
MSGGRLQQQLQARKVSSCLKSSEAETYLSIDHSMFSIDNDLSRRGDHESGHHRRRLLPLHCWIHVGREDRK